MAEFKAMNPDAQVIGRAIMGIAMALGDRAIPILEHHGLSTIDPTGWYRQQAWLDALREIDQGDMFDLIAIGKQVAGIVPLPAEITSAESALMLLGKTYEHNHQGCPGSTTTRVIGEHQLELTVCDPYPRNMVYGVIYGFAARFEPAAVVRYPGDIPCPTEDDCCVYTVTW